MLLAVTAVWGSTFFLIRDLVATVPAADFIAVRFAIAALVMLVLFRRQTLALSRADLRLGAGLGVLYGLAQLLQTVGLQHTAASVSGFVTGTYVVLTPVLAALLLRDRIDAVTWGAALLTTAGLAVLSLRGFSVGYGEGVTLASAVLYAGHIVVLGRWSTPSAAVGLATVQAGVIAGITAVAAVPGGLTLPDGTGQWASLLYMAVVAGAAALWAQTWAQAHLTATRAAIVMAMEPVFAALFAVLLGGEDATTRLLVGGGLVVASMYLVELRGVLARRRRRGATAADDPPVEALHHDV
ncbi:DMT family transporter [Phycicoccus sp. CMS6Z-2]|nr:DMT family transporter [Phycicoccus flavus]